jgi:hypothetical protein
MHRYRLHHSIANELTQIQSCSRSIKICQTAQQERVTPPSLPHGPDH